MICYNLIRSNNKPSGKLPSSLLINLSTALANHIDGFLRFSSSWVVQSPSHIRSFVLYTKCGFILREPLFLMQGQLLKGRNSDTRNADVRLVRDDNDISACNELCKLAHGFSREMELRQAKDQGVATMIERGGVITGYAAGIGIL